jgi:hypothetical protein
MLSSKSDAPVTIERLEDAISLTAYVMQRHNLPHIVPTLKRLEAARNDLLVNGDPIEYAKRVLDRSTIGLLNYKSDPNQPLTHGAS